MSAAEKVCGCMGCRDPAVAIVQIEAYGQRAVCDAHAKGQEVLVDV